MMESEVRRFIQEEIKRHMNVILSGTAGTNTAKVETIESLFPGMAGMPARPVMAPYGIASRAPRGTVSVTARSGNHTGNRIILGHRDENRPSVESGETVLYNQFGHQVELRTDKVLVGKTYQVKIEDNQIQIGKDGTFQTVVCGENLKALLIEIITALTAHTHTFLYSSGPTPNTPGVTLTPVNNAAFQSAQQNYLDNDKILAKDGGGF